MGTELFGHARFMPGHGLIAKTAPRRLKMKTHAICAGPRGVGYPPARRAGTIPVFFLLTSSDAGQGRPSFGKSRIQMPLRLPPGAGPAGTFPCNHYTRSPVPAQVRQRTEAGFESRSLSPMLAADHNPPLSPAFAIDQRRGSQSIRIKPRIVSMPKRPPQRSRGSSCPRRRASRQGTILRRRRQRDRCRLWLLDPGHWLGPRTQ
jgi:hypothetical protein